MSEIAEPGSPLDAEKHGGADAASSLAAQVTLIVIQSNKLSSNVVIVQKRKGFQ